MNISTAVTTWMSTVASAFFNWSLIYSPLVDENRNIHLWRCVTTHVLLCVYFYTFVWMLRDASKTLQYVFMATMRFCIGSLSWQFSSVFSSIHGSITFLLSHNPAVPPKQHSVSVGTKLRYIFRWSCYSLFWIKCSQNETVPNRQTHQSSWTEKKKVCPVMLFTYYIWRPGSIRFDLMHHGFAFSPQLDRLLEGLSWHNDALVPILVLSKNHHHHQCASANSVTNIISFTITSSQWRPPII